MMTDQASMMEVLNLNANYKGTPEVLTYTVMVLNGITLQFCIPASIFEKVFVLEKKDRKNKNVIENHQNPESDHS